jgi:hypothetical protein
MPLPALAILTGSRHLKPLPAVLPAFLLAATVPDTAGPGAGRAAFAGVSARINERALTSLTILADIAGCGTASETCCSLSPFYKLQ